MIRAVATALEASGWCVAFVCVPNTPHVNVVPIPIKHGSAKQRYPDVLATDGVHIRMIEVEPRLSASVARNIITRFREKRQALETPAVWASWRSHVQAVTGCELPARFSPICDLVTCVRLSEKLAKVATTLERAAIRVSDSYSFTED